MISLVDVYRDGPSLQAIDTLYAMLAERPPEASISHKEMPTMAQHRQFVHRRPYEAWYFIVSLALDAFVGNIYLTRAREVGIFIRPQHRGEGFASSALQELRQKHPGRLLANVAPGNAASRAFFEKHGGRLIQVTYELA